MTRTSYFLFRVANPANLVNPANLICPSIRAAQANQGNLANLANLANQICLPVCVAVLANLVNMARVMLLHLANPVVVTQIFSLVCDLCSNTCHPRVA
jgi:hypothetical protein